MKLPKILTWNLIVRKNIKEPSRINFLNERLTSISTDLGYIASVFFPFLALVMLPFVLLSAKNPDNLNYLSIAMALPFIVMNFAILNKDVIDGQSIGKTIYGYQVVNRENETTATDFQCMLRNVTLLIWPIEVVIALFNPTRRIGDLIAGTKLIRVIKKEPETFIDKISDRFEITSKTLYISLIISFLFAVAEAVPAIIKYFNGRH